MDEKNGVLAAGIIDAAYVSQGQQSLKQRANLLKQLLSQRRVPQSGWDEGTIEYMLSQLAAMDSNNFIGSVGLGEREARVACPLVARRHFGLGHGIGRSGDIAAVQPKAAGSSLINKLTNYMALDLLKLAGLRKAAACLVLPMATGMSLVLSLATLRSQRPASAKYIVWPRIDQKSCFKAMLTAGYIPVIVENVRDGDELRTDVEAIRGKVKELGADNVLCVLTTTSCFAPRGFDKVVDVARLCQELDVGHVINNAYGVQAGACTNAITEACAAGRVDAFIQSTDKNFMVPVGGAVVASPSAAFIEALAKTYPGRASMAPILDLFMTMLHWGREGYTALLRQRKAVAKHLKASLSALAAKHGERVLHTKHNPISFALTLDTVCGGGDSTYFGSLLFSRGVSGTRVVAPGATKTIGSHSFTGWGAHHDSYGVTYVTAAASIGLTLEDVDLFVTRLGKAIVEFTKQVTLWDLRHFFQLLTSYLFQRKKHTKKATTKAAATEEVVRDPTAVEGASSGAGGGAGAGAGAGAAAMPSTAT